MDAKTLAVALRRAYYFTELGDWAGPDVDEEARWAAVAKAAAERQAAELEALRAERDALKAAADRYETARLMNPRQWSDAWQLNISTGKPFDEIIDNLRPFMRTSAARAGGGK